MPTLKKPKSPKESSVATKSSFSRTQPQPQTTLEANESQFWKEVEERSKDLIASLIEKVLPISATPDVFNLEKDVDYRVLLRDDLPNFYQDNEEYLAKLESGSWTAEDVEFVAEELVCAYWEIVIKALIERLSDYNGFENTNLSQLKE